jgi:hypothetical protein
MIDQNRTARAKLGTYFVSPEALGPCATSEDAERFAAALREHLAELDLDAEVRVAPSVRQSCAEVVQEAAERLFAGGAWASEP